MTGKQYGALLGAVVLAACTLAGCGSSSDSSSGKAQSAAQEPASKKDTSGTDTAKTADSGEKQEAAGGKEEVIETGETYSYFVAGAELEMNVDLDKYLDTDTNIFNMVQMAQDLGYNETIKDQEGSFGVRLGTGSSLYSGTTMDLVFSDSQAEQDIDGSSLAPYRTLTVSWDGESKGSCSVTQEDVSQARYTIGKSQESLSYEMIILTAYGMSKGRVQAGEDPYKDLLSGADGAYKIPGTEELPADENEEFVEGVEEEEPVVIEETGTEESTDEHDHG